METSQQNLFHPDSKRHRANWIARDAANARLLLGMSTVGSWVIISILGLLTLQTPPSSVSLGAELAKLALFFLGYIAISLPFDWIGGSLIPRSFNPTHQKPFWLPWTRGALLHASLLWLIASVLLIAARQGGKPAMSLCFAVTTVLLILLQRRMASWIAWHPEKSRAASTKTKDTLGLDSRDDAFSGGVVGWPGNEQIIQPANWKGKMPDNLLKHLQERRSLAISSGQRTRGLIAASAWVAAGFLLAVWSEPAPIQTAESLLRIAFYTTLWQFLGLLVLPTLSRRAAIYLDYRQIQQGTPKQQQREFIQCQSELEDGENQRSTVVETIFHPLPSVVNRLAELDLQPQHKGAWNANRMMLYLNWASLGLLSRAVHCNVGRPSLWVLPPVD